MAAHQDALYFAYQGAETPLESILVASNSREATILSQACAPTPVVHSTATKKGSKDGHQPRNATKLGKRHMPCNAEVYLNEVCKACMQRFAVSRFELAVSLHQASVCGAVFPMFLSVFFALL